MEEGKDIYQAYEDLEERMKLTEAWMKAHEQAHNNAYGAPPIPPKTKAECEEKGGKWDEEKKECVFLPGKYKAPVVKTKEAILPTGPQGAVEMTSEVAQEAVQELYGEVLPVRRSGK